MQFLLCLQSFNVRPSPPEPNPPAASHLYSNAHQVYYPLLARATSHLGERRGLPLSLDGSKQPQHHPPPSSPNTHTLTHLPPRANNSPASPPAFWCPISLSHRCLSPQSKGEQTEKQGEVEPAGPLLSDGVSTALRPQGSALEECGLKGHRGKDKYSGRF